MEVKDQDRSYPCRDCSHGYAPITPILVKPDLAPGRLILHHRLALHKEGSVSYTQKKPEGLNSFHSQMERYYEGRQSWITAVVFV